MNNGEFASGRGFNMETLRPYASTKDGLDFLQCYLHPPSRNVVSCAGIPDRDSMSSASIGWELQNTVGPPASAVGVAAWNCLIITLPSMKYLQYVLKWPIGSAPKGPDSEQSVQMNDRLDWSVAGMSGLMSRFRPISRSSTVELNAAALSNQGMAYGCQLRPDRSQYDAAAPNLGTPVQRIEIGTLPTQGGDITFASAKSYTGKAEKGMYIPNSYTQPTVVYVPILGVSAETNNPAGFITELRYSFEGTNYNIRLGTIDGGAAIDPSLDVMSVGAMLFLGISQTASLEIKTILGYEVIPSSRSAWLVSQTEGAEVDDMAVTNAYRIRQGMPDVFPADANFWGMLAGLASKFLPGIIGGLGNMASNGIQGWLNKKAGAQTQSEVGQLHQLEAALRNNQTATNGLVFKPIRNLLGKIKGRNNPQTQSETQQLANLMSNMTMGKKPKTPAQIARRKRYRLRRKLKNEVAVTPLMQQLMQQLQ